MVRKINKKTKGIWDSSFIVTIVILLLLFVYIPILVIIIFSFNDATVGIFPMKGFTLKWYREVFTDPRFMSTLKNSLIVAGISTIVSALIGIPAAYATARYKFFGKAVIQNALFLPLFVPPIFLGVSLASFFSFIGLKFSLLTVILAHTLVFSTYFFIIIRPRLIGFNVSVEEASRDLGASSLQTFRRISFPLIWPSILGCALIAFSTSMDAFVITFFTIGSDSTLPLFIWSMMRMGVGPSINAISSILIISIFILVIIANKISGIKLEI